MFAQLEHHVYKEVIRRPYEANLSRICRGSVKHLPLNKVEAMIYDVGRVDESSAVDNNKTDL